MRRPAVLIFLVITACSSQHASSDADSGDSVPALPACTEQQDQTPCDLEADDGGCAGCTADAGYACYCTPYAIGDASAVWSCSPTNKGCP